MTKRATFGERFESLRIQNGLSQTEIATKFGKTKQAAIAGTIAALPIGGAYVSGKIAIRKWNEKRKKNK